MDFTGWSAEDTYNFIEDASNSPIDRTAALQYWNANFSTEYSWVTPTSGGGGHGLPPHG